jgi:hypothetical protein
LFSIRRRWLVSIHTRDNVVRVVPGLPDARDLADVWLAHSLSCLLDACDVPAAERRRLVESGIDSFESGISTASTTTGETLEPERPERLDACRLTLAFAALAVEARLNRVLRGSDEAEWRALVHLTPVKKFRLARRLLTGLGHATEGHELGDLMAQVFGDRDELVDAGRSPSLALIEASRWSPSHARGMVEASGKTCCLLAALSGRDEGGTARRVTEVAVALGRRADLVSVAGPSREPHSDWYRNGCNEFPPSLIGS